MDSRPQRELQVTTPGVLRALLTLVLVTAGAGVALLGGCGAAPPAASRDSARPDSLRTPTSVGTTQLGPDEAARSRATAIESDLDGDGSDETVWLGHGPGAIWIVDGPSTYRVREKWAVRAASLGDADRDDLPEVIALVEDDEGLHVALFAWRRNRYRERLVTSPIVPPPNSLLVRYDPSSDGDVIDLGEGTTEVSTYRWNGFGFTVVGGTAAGH